MDQVVLTLLATVHQSINIFGTRRVMSQEHLTGALPEGEPSIDHPSIRLGDQSLPTLRDGGIPASTLDRYWCLFNDPRLLPPELTIGPSVVSPEAFLNLTKQVQAMTGIMQTLVPRIPQIL